MNKTKRITSIDVWLQAFHVYVRIFTAQYPHEAPGLMRYGATIQDLAAIMMKTSVFYANLRATSLPWGTIHWELWLTSQINTKKSISASGVAKILDVPRGYCFKFDRGGYCPGCSFKHSCSKCDGPHQAINYNLCAFSKRNASHLPNQCSNKVPSCQIIPQPTSAGASNTLTQ